MKIIKTLLGMGLLALLAGCANAPARGGGGVGMEFSAASVSHGYAVGESQPTDYRQILSDPGPF